MIVWRTFGRQYGEGGKTIRVALNRLMEPVPSSRVSVKPFDDITTGAGTAAELLDLGVQ